MLLPANWIDDGPDFYAADQNNVETAVNTLSAFTAKAVNYTLAATDYFVAADATNGPITQTLPTAVGIAGKRYVIEKVDSTVNTVAIATTSGQTISGAASELLVFPGHRVALVSNGTNWLVADSNYAGALLGYAELLVYTTAINSNPADADLQAAKIPALSITTIGTGRPVTVSFQGQAYNGTADYFCAVQLLTNNSAVGGMGSTCASPVVGEYQTVAFAHHPVLALGTSYTFEVGMWCSSGTTGVYYADGTTPLPMTLTVVGQ